MDTILKYFTYAHNQMYMSFEEVVVSLIQIYHSTNSASVCLIKDAMNSILCISNKNPTCVLNDSLQV